MPINPRDILRDLSIFRDMPWSAESETRSRQQYTKARHFAVVAMIVDDFKDNDGRYAMLNCELGGADLDIKILTAAGRRPRYTTDIIEYYRDVNDTIVMFYPTEEPYIDDYNVQRVKIKYVPDKVPLTGGRWFEVKVTLGNLNTAYRRAREQSRMEAIPLIFGADGQVHPDVANHLNPNIILSVAGALTSWYNKLLAEDVVTLREFEHDRVMPIVGIHPNIARLTPRHVGQADLKRIWTVIVDYIQPPRFFTPDEMFLKRSDGNEIEKEDGYNEIARGKIYCLYATETIPVLNTGWAGFREEASKLRPMTTHPCRCRDGTCVKHTKKALELLQGLRELTKFKAAPIKRADIPATMRKLLYIGAKDDQNEFTSKIKKMKENGDHSFRVNAVPYTEGLPARGFPYFMNAQTDFLLEQCVTKNKLPVNQAAYTDLDRQCIQESEDIAECVRDTNVGFHFQNLKALNKLVSMQFNDFKGTPGSNMIYCRENEILRSSGFFIKGPGRTQKNTALVEVWLVQYIRADLVSKALHTLKRVYFYEVVDRPGLCAVLTTCKVPQDWADSVSTSTRGILTCISDAINVMTKLVGNDGRQITVKDGWKLPIIKDLMKAEWAIKICNLVWHSLEEEGFWSNIRRLFYQMYSFKSNKGFLYSLGSSKPSKSKLEPHINYGVISLWFAHLWNFYFLPEGTRNWDEAYTRTVQAAVQKKIAELKLNPNIMYPDFIRWLDHFGIHALSEGLPFVEKEFLAEGDEFD